MQFRLSNFLFSARFIYKRVEMSFRHSKTFTQIYVSHYEVPCFGRETIIHSHIYDEGVVCGYVVWSK